tara:strand:- start:1672 stop:1905 length:234 start_codon:yes stop_codon:yes gene_type:complete
MYREIKNMKTKSITLSSGLQVNRTVKFRKGNKITIITTGTIKKHSHAKNIIKSIKNLFIANSHKLIAVIIIFLFTYN